MVSMAGSITMHRSADLKPLIRWLAVNAYDSQTLFSEYKGA